MASRLFPSIVAISLGVCVTTSCSRSGTNAAGERDAHSSIQVVDIADDTTDPFNYDDSEPSIAVNPANPAEIAVVAFSGPWGKGVNAPVWKSRDNGAHWSKVLQIPAPPGTGLSGPSDQKVAFDSDGNLYVAELAERTDATGTPDPNGSTQDFIYHQKGKPDDALVPSTLYGDDQPHISVDVMGSSCRNNLYSAWLKTAQNGQSNDQSMDTHSSDHGDHLTNRGVGDNRKFNNRTTRVAVAQDGKAYIVYKMREHPPSSNFESVHFMVKRSDDCGTTWNAIGGDTGISVHGDTPALTLFTDSFGNSSKGKVARARSSDAWISTSAVAGEAYVAYVNRDSSGLSQIYVAQSKDFGTTWSNRRVTDGQNHSAFPEIAVAANGAVGVMYIDFDDSGAKTIFRHKFAKSVDSGKTWNRAILQSLDPSAIDNAASGFLWGDYEGLTSNGNSFYGVFTGESINRTVRQLDPMFFRIQTD